MSKKRRRKLKDAIITEVSGVDRPANNRTFILVKNDESLNKEGGSIEDMTFEEILEKLEDEELMGALKEKWEVRKQWEETVEQEKKELEEKIEELEKAEAETTDYTYTITSSEEAEDDEIEDEKLKKRFDDMQKRLEAAESIAKAERDARLEIEFKKRAEEYSDVASVDAVASVLRKAYSNDEELGEELEEILTSAKSRIGEGELFKSVGDDKSDESKTTYELVVEKAESMAKAESITLEKAINNVLEQDKELYNKYLEEQRAFPHN